MSAFLIGLAILSVILGVISAFNMQGDTVFQQIVSQNYVTHGLLFALLFIGLAFCNWKLKELHKK